MLYQIVEINKSKKRLSFGNKEHTKSRKSETRFDWISFKIDFQNNKDGLNDPKGNKI